MVRCCCRNISEQIGINSCLMCPFTQIWTGINGHNPHFSHVLCHCFLVDGFSFTMELCRNFPVSIVWARGKNLINPMFAGHLFRRWRHGLIIQAASIEMQQLSLSTDRQLLLLPIDQLRALTFVQRVFEIFFPATFSPWLIARFPRRVPHAPFATPLLFLPGSFRPVR